MTVAAPAASSRPASPEDRPFLDALFLAVHRAEFAALGLGEAELDALLRMQARAQRLSYNQTFPQAEDHILLDPQSGGAVGRMLVDRTTDAVHLVDIAILPAEQGRGLGTAAMRALLEQAQHANLPIRLQVQTANRARTLYERLGFMVTGTGVHLLMEFRPPSASVAPGKAATATMSAEAQAWAACVGEEYRVSGEDVTVAAVIRLHDVVPARHQPLRGFSLYFRAVTGPVLSQQIYTLARVAAGEADHGEHLLFLVPLGPVEGIMQYEAVFNS